MKTKKMCSFVLRAVLIPGLLTACGTSPADESRPRSALVRYDHPIGISLSMAEGFTVYAGPDGAIRKPHPVRFVFLTEK